MSEDQFENRATFCESRWGIINTGPVRGFYVHPSGLPITTKTKDLAEAALVQMGIGRERADPQQKIVEVVVTVIEKPATTNVSRETSEDKDGNGEV